MKDEVKPVKDASELAMGQTEVFYDISVLGMAQVDCRARTGVYRVVENVALGVRREPGFTIKYCSSVGNDRDCQQYLKGSDQSGPYLTEFTTRLRKSSPNAIPGRGFWTQLVRQLTGAPAQPVIYHSPYHPIPSDILTRTDIGKVLTVYDMIAVLFPAFFGEGGDIHCRQILESLTPDTTVICISHSTKHDLCSLSPKIDPNRVFVTHLAASDLFFPCEDAAQINRVRQKYSIPGDQRYILSVCTLEPRKNIDLVIRSFIRLLQEQRLPDLCLVLTGAKGWKFEKIFAEIEQAALLENRIIFTGYVADEDLAPLYSGALAFVYPSRYEGFGLPPLEAMQCGTPVISSNSSSLPEVVGDAGIMIDPLDGDALCQAMLDLCQHDGLRQTLRTKGIQQAAGFSWQRCIAETIAVYRQSTVR